MITMQASHLFCAIGAAPHRDPAQASRGFTAIELMVTVAIVAILAALAGPSFTPLIERWRVRDAAETLTSSLYYARSEAIKRGGNIIIQANTGTDWSTGWHVFFDVDNDATQDACVVSETPNECDLQVTPAHSYLTFNLADTTGSISVDRWGMLSHTGGATTAPTNMFFELMPKNKTLSDASAVRLCAGTGGRIVRKKGTESC